MTDRGLNIGGALRHLARTVVPKRVRPRLKAIYYRGGRYVCPVCGSRLRRFLPNGFDFPVLREKDIIGGAWRADIQCPVCDSVDRERLLYLYLRNKTDLFRGGYRILHVAAERGLEKHLRGLGPGYLTADLFDPNAMVRMDVTAIQFEDNFFDVIICNHVLEHVPDDRRAMAELYRVMKPGGWGILQVPLSPLLDRTYEDPSIVSESAREQAFGQSDHVRIYGFDYRSRLEEAGFEVRPYDWTGERHLYGGAGNPHGLNERERLYRVSKS